MMNPTDPNSMAAHLVVQSTVDRISEADPAHLVKILEAAKGQEKAQQLIHQGKWVEARSLYRTAMSDLPDIPGTASFRALLCAFILESHAAVAEYKEALEWAPKALDTLGSDPRWRPLFAACLNNTAVSLFEVGRVDEAVSHLEKAIDQFELVNNAAPQTRQCAEMLQTMRDAQASQTTKTKSLWSRLFG